MKPGRRAAAISLGVLAVALLAFTQFARASVPQPDFALSAEALQEGRNVTYTIHFDNVGAAPSASVVLKDTLPAGSAYVGEDGYVVGGVWTRTYTNVPVGPHSATFAVVLPESTNDGDRVLNVADLQFTDAKGNALFRSYSLEFGVSLAAPTIPTPPVPAWVVAAPVAAVASLAGGVGIVRRRRRPEIEQVFLMHRSGMLIHHWAANVSPSRDIDILSGMFVILKEFVRDSFREKAGGLTEFQFGDARVFIAEGGHAILAAVVSGDHVNGMPSQIALAVEHFEQLHGGVLQNWNGHLGRLPGARGVVDGLVRGDYRTRRAN